MREIRFRAWDKDAKEMIPLFNIDFEHNIMNKGSLWKSLYSVELLQYIVDLASEAKVMGQNMEDAIRARKDFMIQKGIEEEYKS